MPLKHYSDHATQNFQSLPTANRMKAVLFTRHRKHPHAHLCTLGWPHCPFHLTCHWVSCTMSSSHTVHSDYTLESPGRASSLSNLLKLFKQPEIYICLFFYYQTPNHLSSSCTHTILALCLHLYHINFYFAWKNIYWPCSTSVSHTLWTVWSKDIFPLSHGIVPYTSRCLIAIYWIYC